jgi:hypothetical protein
VLQVCLWNATRIKCRVPAKAGFGWLKVKVTTKGGASNARSFKVKCYRLAAGRLHAACERPDAGCRDARGWGGIHFRDAR